MKRMLVGMSLTQRLATTLILFTVGVAATTGIFAYTIARSVILEQAVNTVNIQATLRNDRIRSIVDRDIALVVALTRDHAIEGTLLSYLALPTEEYRGILANQLKDFQDRAERVRRIELVGLDGRIIASSDPGRANIDVSADAAVTDGWTRLAVALTKNGNGAPRFVLSAPVVAEGKPAAIAVIDGESAEITDVTKDYLGLGETGETLLLGELPGGAVASLAPSRFNADATFSAIAGSDPRAMTVARSLKEDIQADADATVLDYRGAAVIAASRRISEAGWATLVKIDKQEVLRSLGPIAEKITEYAILLILLSVSISIIIVHAGLRPLRRLTKAAKQIAEGATDVAVTVTSGDEIGDLTTAFNDLAQRVGRSRHELEHLVDEKTAELSIQVSDLERTKKELLKTLADLEQSNRKLKIASEQSETQRKMMVEIVERLPSGILFISMPDGTVEFINAAGMQLCGFASPDAILGKKFEDAAGVTLADGSPIPNDNRAMTIAARNKKPTVTKNEFLTRANGEKIDLKVTAVPIFSHDGRVISVVDILDDVTREQKIDRAKTEFVALASHQLQMPLTTIRWYLEALLSGDAGKINKRQREYINDILQTSRRMIELVTTLLNMTKVEFSTIAARREPIDVREIAKSLLEELAPQIKMKHLTLKTAYGKNPIIMIADRTLLRIVFQNLLSNAVKYTPDGGRVTFTASSGPDGFAFSVTDTGYGIPESQQKHIFSKLFRADSVQTHEIGGTGLGLYSVKTIVDAAGGTITFVSKENQGTTFTVTFPPSGMRQGTEAG